MFALNIAIQLYFD